MSVLFTIQGSLGTSVSFNHDEATDGGTTKPSYSIELGSERSASGVIKQQIRPGKRYRKEYQMCLSVSKYIDFLNLIVDQSNNYFINYTTAPELLTSDSSVTQTNDFKIAIDYRDVEETVGNSTIYKFKLLITSVNLL